MEVVKAAADEVSAAQSSRSRGRKNLDYERMDNGDVEFDYEEVSFESEDGDIELRLDTGNNAVDLEVNGAGLRHHSGDDVEFEAAQSPDRAFEAEQGDIEYRTDSIDLDWDMENADLDIRGDISLEVNLEDGIDLEYGDSSISMDFDTNGSTDLEYTGEVVDLDWENGDKDDFEARQAGSLL